MARQWGVSLMAVGLALAIATGAAAQQPVRNRTDRPARPSAVTVGGRAFSAQQYRQALAVLGAPAPESLSPAARRAEARNFVRFERLLQAARRTGLDRGAAYQEQRRGAAQKLLVRMYSAQLLARARQVPADAVATYYQAHRSRFAKLSPQLARAQIHTLLFHRRYRQAMAALRRGAPARLDPAFFAAAKSSAARTQNRR